MADIDLKALGFTNEEVLEKVVDRIVAKTLGEPSYDEDGEECGVHPTKFARKVQELTAKRIDKAVEALVDKHVTPQLMPKLESLLLQPTSLWGEKKGEPLTFIEWCMRRAVEYMNEKVDDDGKAPTDNYYRDRCRQSRLSWIVSCGLSEKLSEAVSKTLGEANKTLVASIEKDIKEQMAKLATALKVNVAR